MHAVFLVQLAGKLLVVAEQRADFLDLAIAINLNLFDEIGP